MLAWVMVGKMWLLHIDQASQECHWNVNSFQLWPTACRGPRETAICPYDTYESHMMKADYDFRRFTSTQASGHESESTNHRGWMHTKASSPVTPTLPMRTLTSRNGGKDEDLLAVGETRRRVEVAGPYGCMPLLSMRVQYYNPTCHQETFL